MGRKSFPSPYAMLPGNPADVRLCQSICRRRFRCCHACLEVSYDVLIALHGLLLIVLPQIYTLFLGDPGDPALGQSVFGGGLLSTHTCKYVFGVGMVPGLALLLGQSQPRFPGDQAYILMRHIVLPGRVDQLHASSDVLDNRLVSSFNLLSGHH